MSPTITVEKTPLDALRDARDLLTPRENWTKRNLAKDAHGLPVEPDSPLATCYCALGALTRVTGLDVENDRMYDTPEFHLYIASSDALSNHVPQNANPTALRHSVPGFNDHALTEHGDVIALFNRAIASEVAKAA